MNPSPVSVLCVEDNKLVAEVLGRRLRDTTNFVWLGCVGTQEDLMAVSAEKRPSVVCMDLNIPGQDTYAMIRTLTQAFPETRVLVLSGQATEDTIVRAVDAGAMGYLSKAESPSLILESIRRVALGEFVLEGVAQRACTIPLAPKPRSGAGPSPTVQTPGRSWNPFRGLFAKESPNSTQ